MEKMNSQYTKINDVRLSASSSEVIRIDVFTSEYCSFCDDALDVAHTAARKAGSLSNNIDVIETSVDDRPDLIETLNLVALPLIQIGHSQIIGLPNQEDIERLIHQRLLMGE